MTPTPRKPSNNDGTKGAPTAKTPMKEPTAKDEAKKPAPNKELTRRSTQVRIGVLLGLMFLGLLLLGWEYRASRSHDTSLARLKHELEHRKLILIPLSRTEIPKLLAGTASAQAESGTNTQTDYYTWHGLFHEFHIRVDSDHTGKVYNIENIEELLSGKTASTPTSVVNNPQSPVIEPTPKPVPAAAPVFKPNPAPHVVTEDELIAALKRAEELYEPQGNQTEEFREVLRSVYDALPEAKTSTVKGELHWNSFKLARRKSKLCAVRFQVPFAGPAELDYVQATKWVRINMGLGLGNAAAEKDYLQLAKWVTDRGIIPCGSSPGFGDMRSENQRTSDMEPFVKDIEGLTLPPENRLVFQSTSLENSAPETRFIQWYWTGGGVTWRNGVAYRDRDPDPSVDFELDSLVFVSPAGKTPLRVGAHEVCDFIGLRTGIPTYPPTEDGARTALQVLGERIPRLLYHGTTFDRILRQVRTALPEFQVSATPEKVIWSKVEFPHGSLAALRGRIPESIGKKVELYGLLALPGPSTFGWDHNSPKFGRFNYRRVRTGQVADIPLTPQALWVFSQPEGTVEPGQEFVFWIRSDESPRSQIDPAFVALTAVPHDETQERDEPLSADKYPWSCAKLAGVAIPTPPAPEGCVVLGWHERKISQLHFTPDSRRLVSIDQLGDARIWNVESQQLEGTIKLPLMATEHVLISPDSRTLLVLDKSKQIWNRWEIDSRQPLPAMDSGLSQNEILRAVNFGVQPNQVVTLGQKNVSTLEHEHGFLTRDLQANRTIQTSALARESLGHTYHSLVYLPSLNLFAVGVSRAVAPPRVQISSTTANSFVQLWQPDFTRPVRELPFGTHSQQRGQDQVLLSYQPNGRRLAAICSRRFLKVWDIDTWTELLSKSWGKNPNSPQGTFVLRSFSSISLSADGETVATISHDDSTPRALEEMRDYDASDSLENTEVSLWSVATGELRIAYTSDNTSITQVTHSLDNRWVATANRMGVIRLWKNTP